MPKSEASAHVFEPQTLGGSISSISIVRLVAWRPDTPHSDKQPSKTVGMQASNIPQLLLLTV